MSFLDRFKIASSEWRLPGEQDRVSIVGKTGSGKTVMGLHILREMQLYEKMPWVIIDYKGDDHIAKIPARILPPRSEPPKEPGLYKLSASPFQNANDPVDAFLKKVWHNGDTGLFFDEAYMLPDRYGRTDSGTLRALFTTGRSRHIPIISLSQRPVDVTRYNFSEASHHVIFRLNDKRDRDTVRQYVPQEHFDSAFESGTPLKKHHSLWYDVDEDNVFEMLPCPDPKTVVSRFRYLAEKTKWK